MLKIFLLTCLTVNLLVDGFPLDDTVIEEQIVGGNDTDISKVPYQIAMNRAGTFVCGGSIFSPIHIVTAAHCVHGELAKRVTIRAGSSSNANGGVIIKGKKLYKHPKFNTTNWDYDVAIIELETPLKFDNKTIKPITLINKELSAGIQVLVSGWGALKEDGPSSQMLQSVTVPVVDRKICTTNYNNQNYTITPRMICAGLEGKDSCEGDSGGPLVYKGELAGIVSFGIGCARKEFPGVYTNIADPEISTFIKNIVKS